MIKLIKSKYFMNNFSRRVFPVFFGVVLLFTVIFTSYDTAYASSMPFSCSGYDLVYSLLQSLGITSTVIDKGDGLPMPYNSDYYQKWLDEFSASAENLDWGNLPIDKFMDELKALPSKVKNGAVTMSQELWTFLNQAIPKQVAGGQVIDTSTSDNIYNYLVDTLSIKSNPQYLHCIADAVASGALLTIVYDNVCMDRGCVVASDGIIGSYAGPNDRGYYMCTDGSSVIYAVTYYIYDGCAYEADKSIDGFDHMPVTLVSNNTISASDTVFNDLSLVLDIMNHAIDLEQAVADGLVNIGTATDTAEGTDEKSQPVVLPITITGVGDKVIDDEATKDDTGEGEKDQDLVIDIDLPSIKSLPDKVASKAGEISEVFPFCIPFDVVKLVKGLKASEKPPVFHFKYYFKTIKYTFEIKVDLSEYEKYFKIFRAGISIFWVITLMLLTIRWSSGVVKD